MQNPAFENFQIRIFLTPSNDALFWEKVDCTKQRNWDTVRGTAHWDVGRYPNHKLVYIEPIDNKGTYFFYYAAERSSQDAYNWEFAEADIGGTPYAAVVRTYVYLRSSFSATTPAMGASMPNFPNNVFGTGSGSPSVVSTYVLGKRKQIRIPNEKLDSLFIQEELTYFKRCTHSDIRFDEETDSHLLIQTNLYYGTESLGGTTVAALFLLPTNAYWDLSSTGVQREGKQISCNWYEITTIQMVPPNTATTITGAAISAIPIRSYGTENDYLWPAILRAQTPNEEFGPDNDLVWINVAKKVDGVVIDAEETFVRVQLANPAYRGPTRMMVEEWWSMAPFASEVLPTSEVMIPKEVEHQGVNYSLRLEPTLHGVGNLIDFIGTEDPDYDTGDYGQDYTATEPFEEWPESLIVSVDQRPFRGGYKITVITAYRPDHYVEPTP